MENANANDALDLGFDFADLGAEVPYESLTVQVQEEAFPCIQTTSNKGNIKLNVSACKLLKVPYGLVSTPDKSHAGVRVEFRIQKWNGVDEKVINLVTIGSKDGAKLASSSDQNGGLLMCSSGNAWKTLDGDKDFLKNYSIDEADSAVLFNTKAGNAPISVAFCEEKGLISNGSWTALAEQNRLGKAGELAKVYFKLTFVNKDAKREVSKGVTGRPKKAKVAKPFAAGTEEVVVDTTNDSDDLL